MLKRKKEYSEKDYKESNIARSLFKSALVIILIAVLALLWRKKGLYILFSRSDPEFSEFFPTERS